MIDTYWNGLSTPCVRGTLTVGEAPVPTFWWAKLTGQKVRVVRVDWMNGTFYLYDEDGSGWFKVTDGHGSPAWGHKNINGTDFQPDVA